MHTVAESEKSAKSALLLLRTILVAGFWLLLAAAGPQSAIEIDHRASAGQGVPRLQGEREVSTTEADLTGAFTKMVWSSDGAKLAAYNSGGESHSDAGNTIRVSMVAGGRSGVASAKIVTELNVPNRIPSAFREKTHRLESSCSAVAESNSNVCIFIELVKYYNLPKLSAIKYGDPTHVRKLSETTDLLYGIIEIYEYTDEYVTAEIEKSKEQTFYGLVRLSAIVLPPELRSRSILSWLNIKDSANNPDQIMLSCESLVLGLYFRDRELLYLTVNSSYRD